MDAGQFDSLTRSAANRRQLLARLSAGGVGAALWAVLGPRRITAAQVTCSLELRATVRLGPSAGIPLVANATEAGALSGTLEMTISDDGALSDAAFLLVDGTSLPVVGQAVGHQLAARVALSDGTELVVQGVGEQPLQDCSGRVDGSLVGPGEGDLGDWHAIGAGRAASDVGAAGPSLVSVTSAAAAPTVTTPEPTPISLVPTTGPTPTAVCLPLGPSEVCDPGSCGSRDDGCGGTVECGLCVSPSLCFNGACCNPGYWETICNGNVRCGYWDDGCGSTVDCGSSWCPSGFECSGNSGYCCGVAGQGCSVGSECCSGSCSPLNGCR